jgi:hypothetical protein
MLIDSPSKEHRTDFSNNKTQKQSPSLPIDGATTTKTTKKQSGCKTQHGEKHQSDLKL